MYFIRTSSFFYYNPEVLKNTPFVSTLCIALHFKHFEFSRLFEVILTDNGAEFSDPESIELSTINGERLSHVFYCDPNASWQKGSLEKNHEYIRYVLPKGTSFAGLTQEDCTLLASHINSVPRKSLNNHSPYEAALAFIGENNIAKFNISPIPYDDIDLTIRLLRR